MKCTAYFFTLFDGCLHTVLIFGWVTLTEIFKREGFFENLCTNEVLNTGKRNEMKLKIIKLYEHSFFVISISLLSAFLSVKKSRIQRCQTRSK